MTFNIMWKRHGRIFAASDSISMVRTTNPTRTTSFGQIAEGKGVAYYENALKTFNLDDTFLVQVAGDAAKGMRFAAILNTLRRRVRPEEALRMCFHLDLAGCQIHVGHYLNGDAEILKYDGHRLLHVDRLASSGSIDEVAESFMVQQCLSLDEISLSHDLCVPAVQAAFQAFVAHHPTLEDGVGGYFLCCSLGVDGCRWQEHTSFYLYDNDLFENATTGLASDAPPGWVSPSPADVLGGIDAVMEQHALYVESNIADETILMATPLLTEADDEGLPIGWRKALNCLRHKTPKYVVFISKQAPIATVVPMTPIVWDKKFLRIVTTGEHTRLEISENLREMLKRAPRRNTNLDLPVAFHPEVYVLTEWL